MTDINLTGIPGTPGVNGTTPGQPGTAGGAGGNAAPAQNTGNGIDTLNTEEATGGAGGAGGNGDGFLASAGAGAGGNGGSATASTSTTLNSTAGITSTATATGGVGGNAGLTGYYGHSAHGGDGGTATASAASANGAGVARATATATGGYGGAGSGFYGGVAGGVGGIASNTTANASGISAYATVSQTGGAGGRASYAQRGAAGASSTLTNAVSGTTTGGTLSLSQTATGGAGGNAGYYGSGGQGGAATSSLTFNDVSTNTTHATTLMGYSTANGGAGGAGHYYGPAAGGAATAVIALTGANVVNATASARGGAGSIGAASADATSFAASIGTQGSATAHATATTANGELATASATATGATGSDDSTAVTQGRGVVTTVSAFAQAQVGSTTLAESNSGNQLGSSGFNGTNNNSYAFATEVPNSSLVTSILNTNSNLETALGNGTVFGLATEGASYSTTASGSRTYTDTITYTLDTTALSGHLIAGLINDQSFGNGFDSLDFNVVENGTTIFDQTFTSLSAAQTFFTNDALDLGTLPIGPNQTIDFNFSLTTSASGAGFGAQFLLGATGGNQPLTGQVVLNTATEGVALPATTQVATFADTNTSDTASNFTATIDWGDGTTTTGVVSGSNGAFTVTGGHTYADEGSFPLGVTITDTANNTSVPLSSGTVTAAEADVLTAHGLTFIANPGQAFSGTVATFTDSDTSNVASDFSATINWGDGTTTAGAITDTAGAISVSGTHTFTTMGQHAVSVTLSDDEPGTATATASSTANVAGVAGLAGHTSLTAAKEGVALPSTTKVATFTDTNRRDTASSFTATINWGDGTRTSGRVSGSNGAFTVTGGHTFAGEGSFPLGVTITDKANSTSLPLSGTVAVAETDVLSARGLTFRANAGHAFTGKVATFTDRNTGNVAGDFSATINWGDGTTTPGVITDTRGTISVSGTHTYASSGRDAVTVTLTDGAPGTATATAHSTATVTGTTTALAASANSAGSSGALTVSDGQHAQSLALLGQYMASSFVTTSDGHDSTLITVPPPDQQSLLSHPHAQ